MVCSQTQGAVPISSYNSLVAHVPGPLPELRSQGCAPRPVSTPFLTHPHPGKDESSHLCTPPPPSWFYSTCTTAFSTGSILILQLTTLPLSFFSPPPPHPTTPAPLQGADQFTVFLGGVRKPHTPLPSTHCHS